ncbi:hypothetical protein Ancab_029926 [Ancistrocladus abbreviatus]
MFVDSMEKEMGHSPRASVSPTKLILEASRLEKPTGLPSANNTPVTQDEPRNYTWAVDKNEEAQTQHLVYSRRHMSRRKNLEDILKHKVNKERRNSNKDPKMKLGGAFRLADTEDQGHESPANEINSVATVSDSQIISFVQEKLSQIVNADKSLQNKYGIFFISNWGVGEKWGRGTHSKNSRIGTV